MPTMAAAILILYAQLTRHRHITNHSTTTSTTSSYRQTRGTPMAAPSESRSFTSTGGRLIASTICLQRCTATFPGACGPVLAHAVEMFEYE